jgi:hypothetical protein
MMLELRYLPLLLVHTQQSFFDIGLSSEEIRHRIHARTVSEEKPWNWKKDWRTRRARFRAVAVLPADKNGAFDRNEDEFGMRRSKAE